MPDVDMNSLVPSEVPTSTASTVTSTLSVIKTEPKSQEQLATVRDEKTGGQTKMTLGQLALAGIVISSGPGDHFETYEG